MFTDTGDYRYVYLGVGRVPERVETSGPRCNVACVGQKDHHGEHDQADDGYQAEE